MRLTKFLLSLFVTVALIYFLDNRWVVGGQPIPPLGKFLDPFQGFWQNIESKNIETHDKLRLPQLKAPVKIIFDSLMIPHIFAENEDDLYFAQGFVTAYHRLWQMEFQVMAAAGRLSEIIPGDAVLDFDRRQRRLGMAWGAENATRVMMEDRDVNRAVTRYADGVSAYIQSLSYRELPFEYKLLDYRPEMWSPGKAGLLLMNLSQSLNIGDADLEMTNALNLYGAEVLELLYAENDHPAGDPIVDQPGTWSFEPLRLDSIPLAVPSVLADLPPATKKVRGIGSNNWAVHGSRTTTGSPILSNDPHLNLTLPSIWYVVHLNAPGVNAMGASFPGAPQVILGFNDSIAWGCTNAQRDLTDWYHIKFRDDTQREYLSDGEWKKTTTRVEEFRVRDGDVFYDTVYYTHHGPVVYDRSFHRDHAKNSFAFRWIAHDGSRELKTFNLLNRARNYDDFQQALRYWSGPAQNFVFASTRGDIAMHVRGKFPVRRKNEGRFVLDGTLTNTEWKAFIPEEHQIRQANPPRGFVSSANQYPVDATYPYYIQSHGYETFRNRRINQVLSENSKVAPADMMKLQNDNYNLQAAESLPLMLTLLDTAALRGEQSRIAEELGYWNYFNSRESMAATYYQAWWNSFVDLMFDEFDSAKVSLNIPDESGIIRLMKTKPDFDFFDIKATPEKETVRELVNLAFHEGARRVSAWENERQQPAEWADYKDTFIQHLLRMEPLSRHVRAAGYSGIVNATGRRHGPSWRVVVSLEQPVKAWGVYPGGQSGNPGSAFYDNLIPYWADGNYYQLVFSNDAAAIEKNFPNVMLLTPEEL